MAELLSDEAIAEGSRQFLDRLGNGGSFDPPTHVHAHDASPWSVQPRLTRQSHWSECKLTSQYTNGGIEHAKERRRDASPDKSFAFAGAPVNPIPVGIAVRKGDALEGKIRGAVTALYGNGTIKKILSKWKMSDFALQK